MEEQLYRSVSDSQFRNKQHPGRMWGILHILDYHNWHTVKKILPHKRHGSGRNGSLKDDKTKLCDPDTCETQEFEASEVAKLLAEEKMSGTSPTKKRSRKARSKKLSIEEIPKEDVHKHKISAFPSRLLRTDSIHHLEPSHHNLPDEIRRDDVFPSLDLHEDDSNSPSTSTSISLPRKISFHKRCEVCSTISAVKSLGPNQLDELRRQLIENPIVFQDSPDKSKQAFLKQKTVGDKDNGDAALYQPKKVLDALEMFSVKKELLLTILQDPDYALTHHFQGLWASNAKRGLKKSGSFPVSSLNIKPIKLKYKQNGNEVLEGKLRTENPISTLTHSSSEGNQARIEPLVANNTADNVEKPEQVGSSLSSSHELKKRGRRFKDIKQKIKHVIKESRKEGHRISMDAILHKIPYGRKFSKNGKREMAIQWKEGDTDCKHSSLNSYEGDSCGYSTSKGGFNRMRRSPSLNESLDKYSRLFESSFNREAKKHLSHGRKLSNENACLPSGHATKSFRRILSLPDLESYCAFQREDLNDTHSEKSTGVLVQSDRNDENLTCDEQSQSDIPGSFAERLTQENLVEGDESSLPERDEIGLGLNDNSNEISKVGESELSAMAECSSNSQSKQEYGFTNNASSKLPQPSPPSVLDFSFQEDAASRVVKLSIFEGQELTTRHIHSDEADSLGDQHDRSGLESPSASGSTTSLENIKIPSMDSDSEYVQVQVDEKDEADFIYVRDVLKLSGFTGNQYLGTWHSADQPVDPLLFKELEGFTPHKLECTADEAASIDYDHQLLFDIINEVLLEIYARSFTYWPLPLSTTSSIRPMPIGCHVLEEVWSSVCWYLNLPPADDPSLDYVMARDLAKADGWMNLQVDMECVGLELEELILDDLLEEVIYS